MGKQGESSAELIKLAQTNGYPVTATKLAYWHRRRLLPKPTQVPLGKAHGTMSVYPIGTGEQLLALCEIHQTEKRLERVAWSLWWRGYDVAFERVQPFLKQAATQFERARQELIDPTTGELSDTVYDQIDKASSFRLAAPLSGARRRVGTTRFGTFFAILSKVVAGLFVEPDPYTDETEAEIDRSILDRGFGVERAHTHRIGTAEPWLPRNGIKETLGLVSPFLGQCRWTAELTTLTEADFCQARDEVRSWLEVLAQFSAIFDQLFGKGAFGLSVMSKMIRSMKVEDQAIVLVMWTIVRFKHPMVLPGIAIWVEAMPKLTAGIEAWHLLKRLRNEVPGLAEILSRGEFAAALRDPKRMEGLEHRLHQFREHHAEELAAFWRAHPEYNYAHEHRSSTYLKSLKEGGNQSE